MNPSLTAHPSPKAPTRVAETIASKSCKTWEDKSFDLDNEDLEAEGAGPAAAYPSHRFIFDDEEGDGVDGRGD